MSTVATISAVAGKKGLEKVVDDIYKTGKDQLRIRFKRWKARKNIGVLYTQIKNIRKVKTILQPEKAIDLLKFYYPCKVKIDDKPKTIRDISDLHRDGNIVIKGMVGQGKSIFFRYLTSREMVKGKKIPLFVELRRIGKGEKLVDHMVEEANALGLKGLDKGTFLWLAEKGKVVLLLDAFDEIPESERTRITTEIERLAKKYEHLQILVSSRPNSGIENSPIFKVFEMAQLEGQEYVEAISVMAEEDIAGNIIKSIRSSRTPIRELLTTPLMVALLIVRHRIEQSIPENLIGFYKGLFTLLISRHDKMKGGYTRPRKSGLGDSSLENLFEGICFLTRKEGKGVFSRRDLTSYAKESARLSSIKCDSDKVVDDIIKITCMILQEGEECRLIHKSLQEYHSANFIRNQPDEIARRFYVHAAKPNRVTHEHWREELLFLKIIDKYRFLKFFLILATKRMLGLDVKSAQRTLKVTREMIVQVFGGLCGIGPISKFMAPPETQIESNIVLIRLVRDGVFNGLSNIAHLLKEIGDREHSVTVAIQDFSDSEVGHALRDWAVKSIKEIHSEIVSAENYVKEVESRKEIFEF